MTFFTFDDDDLRSDQRDVLSASAILEITEFRLFELAYQRWHGADGTEKEIEKFFTAYMFSAVVPPWVRQYCRQVLICERAGHLVPEEFGVEPQIESETMFVRGVRYASVLVFLMAALHLVAILVTEYR